MTTEASKFFVPVLLVVALLSPLVLAQQNCPSSEWIENGDFCYLLVKGANGRTFDQARTDCQSRGSGSDLLWISSEGELSWFQDYSARQWSIKRDWSQCSDCVKNIEAAWIGAYRSDTGIFKWTIDDKAVEVKLNWWLSQPKEWPADYVLAYDSGSQMRYRTETKGADRKFWHFCKVQHREPTTSTPMSTTTLPPYLGPCPARDWTEQGDSCYLLVRGDTGRGVDEAARDCSSRHPQAGLLWIESAEEAAWVTDNSKAAWNLKRDWAQCRDCQSDSAAWTSLRRSGGVWGWGDKTGIDQSSINWFFGHPRDPPNDFGSLYDSGTSQQLRVRSENATSKMWHICKFRYSEYTGPTNSPRPTSSTPQSTTTSVTTTTRATTTKYVGNCPSSEWLEFEHSCYLLVKGTNGRAYSEARADCQSRNADLLWVRSDREMAWIRDYAGRTWGIKRDWRQCTNCDNIEAAWFGLYRDLQDRKIKWAHDQTVVDIELSWWITDPLPSPNDYGVLFDSGSQLRLRLLQLDRVLWHFCKIDYEESTATTPRPTTGTPRPTRYPPGPCINTDWTAYGDSCYTLVKNSYGINWSGALTACKALDYRAELLWLSSRDELRWLLDFNARNWRLSADYRQCLNCTSLEGAWVGLFRDSSGNFRWKNDLTNNTIDLSTSWFFGHPKGPPNNFVMIYDRLSTLYLRTEVHDDRYWYFCKYNYRYSTPPLTQPTVSTSSGPTSGTVAPIGPCPEVGEPWIEYNGNCYSVRKPRQGLTWSEARDACRSVSETSDLAWLESESELAWLIDYSVRSWNIKADWRSCANCNNVEGAWIGLFRDEEHDGLLKWAFNGRTISIAPNWWPEHPKQSPNNYGLLFDTSTSLRMRTEVGSGRYWYFCKAVGKYPATQPTQQATFWTSGAVHILWVIPLLLVLAGLAFYMIRAHRRRSAPSNLESASQPVMMRENPAFNSYSALGNVQSNQPNGKTASLDGDSVAVTLKDRLEDDDVA